MYGKLDFLNCAFGIVPPELDGYESTLDAPAFDISNINSTFLLNRIIQRDFYKKNGDIANGSRKAKRIHPDTFLSMEIISPTLQEQEKIAKFIICLDKRIEKQRQLVELLKSYKRGVLNHIFNQQFDFDWQEVYLGDICHITMGQSPDSTTYNTEQNGLPLVQGNADITDGVTTPQRYTSAPTKICEAGSVILSVRAPVGSVSRANQRICLGRGVCAITAPNTDFIYQLLVYHQDDWKRIEQGGTFTAISGDDISFFKVTVPNIETQSTISNLLSKYDARVQREVNVLRVLKGQKEALMQQLFI